MGRVVIATPSRLNRYLLVRWEGVLMETRRFGVDRPELRFIRWFAGFAPGAVCDSLGDKDAFPSKHPLGGARSSGITLARPMDESFQGEEMIEELLSELIRKFVDKYEIGCPESLYQRDVIYEEALPFIESLIEIVGYWRDTEDCES